MIKQEQETAPLVCLTSTLFNHLNQSEDDFWDYVEGNWSHSDTDPEDLYQSIVPKLHHLVETITVYKDLLPDGDEYKKIKFDLDNQTDFHTWGIDVNVLDYYYFTRVYCLHVKLVLK